MSLSAEDLRKVVRTIWSTQLKLELEDAELNQLEEAFDSKDVVTNQVRFSGGFNGRLVQRGSRQLALLAAGAAFATRGGDLGASDARDVLAELAHVTAGNLKSRIPGANAVSLPGVVENGTASGEIIAEVGFQLGGEPLVVTLRGE